MLLKYIINFIKVKHKFSVLSSFFYIDQKQYCICNSWLGHLLKFLLCHFFIWEIHAWTSATIFKFKIRKNLIMHVDCGGLMKIWFFVFAERRPSLEGGSESFGNWHHHTAPPPSSPCVSQVRPPQVQDAVRSQSPDCI